MDWWSVTRSTILGISEKDVFWMLDKRVFFRDKEIVLQERSHRLLSGLVQASESFCTKEQLIEQGWPGENPSGISVKALSESPDNFALDNVQISGVKCTYYYRDEDPSEWHVEFQTTGGNHKFITTSDPEKPLKAVFGPKVTK